MKKSDFIDLITKKLAKSKVEITKKDLDLTMKAIFEGIGDVVKKDDSILIPGFGSFKQGKRSARTGRNPQTGEMMKIKAKKVAQFKPSATLKEKIN